jgi:hypothetical protein
MILSGLVLLIAAASTVQAQDRPRGGGFQFGFGGGGMFGGASFDANLLASPEVQKELGVSDEQKGLIEDMLTDLQSQRQQAFRQGGGGFQNFQDLSEDERRKLIEEGQKRMEEMNKKTEEMINMVLEPKQTERFGQLRLQRAGVGAFNRLDIAEKLALTQEQKDKMQKIQEANRPDPSAFASFRDMSEEERREAFAKLREKGEKANAEILNLLTGEQKESWAKLQGKKFEFPPQQGFGGGRRPETKKNNQ